MWQNPYGIFITASKVYKITLYEDLEMDPLARCFLTFFISLNGYKYLVYWTFSENMLLVVNTYIDVYFVIPKKKQRSVG